MRGFRVALGKAGGVLLGILAVGCSSPSSPAGGKGATTLPTTAVIAAHQGAWIEQIDGKPFPAPKVGLFDQGNRAVVSPGRHQLAIRTELDKSSTGGGAGLTITIDTAQVGKLYEFELDLKPGHVYEIMSAGQRTGRLEILDKTVGQLQFYDWGSRKLIADKSDEKAVRDYVAPNLAEQQAAIVKGNGGTNVCTVDGAHVPGTNAQLANFGGNKVVLTPGTHRIVARRLVQSMAMTTNDVAFEQEFVAGHVYEVGPDGLFGTGIKLEDKTAVLAPAKSASTPQIGGTMAPLQAVRDADDEDDDDEDERPAQAMRIKSAAVRTYWFDKQMCVDVAAVVQLDAVENIRFTLKATVVDADGRPLQAGGGPLCATRVIYTADDSDEDTYRLSIKCGAAGAAWRSAKVRVELLDPTGGVRSVLPLQSIRVVSR